ncbi:hypothetical protein BDN70DRAFT_892372 [Pholiota conissans]|uniref:Uncharacterized protein n=1 Tax=Pholiota conissans TaxID=109636 RepID=A0A9P6D3R4_9AGAR|nr:hypothetical protein BDN70DRAFT_892372 [Pholiota conissans]
MSSSSLNKAQSKVMPQVNEGTPKPSSAASTGSNTMPEESESELDAASSHEDENESSFSEEDDSERDPTYKESDAESDSDSDAPSARGRQRTQANPSVTQMAISTKSNVSNTMSEKSDSDASLSDDAESNSNPREENNIEEDVTHTESHPNFEPKDDSMVSDVGEIPFAEAKQLLGHIKEASKPFVDLLDQLKDIPIIANLIKILKELENQLDALADFREQAKSPDATIVSFSRLSWPKLEERAGVKAYQIDFSTILSVIAQLQNDYKSITSGRTLHEVSSWKHHSLKTKLLSLNQTTLQKKEAAARLTIDAWIDGLQTYLEAENVSFLQIPELTIQSSDEMHSPDFVIVHYGGHVTAFTGTSDYAIITGAFGKGQGVSKDLKEALTFNKIATKIASLDCEIILIEAKAHHRIRKIKTKDDEKRIHIPLKNYLPQAIGQCIPFILLMSNDRVTKRKAAGFCLTDGIEWIFGIIFTSEPALKDQLYEVIILPPLKVKAEDIPDSIDATCPEPDDQYTLLLKLLLTWTKIPSPELCIALKREIEGTDPKLVQIGSRVQIAKKSKRQT